MEMHVFMCIQGNLCAMEHTDTMHAILYTSSARSAQFNPLQPKNMDTSNHYIFIEICMDALCPRQAITKSASSSSSILRIYLARKHESGYA